MARSVFRTVLVIGDNHEEIIKKYSLDTIVKPYVRYKRDDAKRLQDKHILFIESLLTNPNFKMTERQKELYKNLYLSYKEMDEFDYYLELTEGCKYDEETGDAISTENPNAFYRNEKCYHKRLIQTNGEEEAPFSNPFKLKNGSKAYIARYDDIDWELNHLYGTELYERVWDLCVKKDSPVNEQETMIKNNMANRDEYFNNFANCDEYVKHSCSFWCYGIATEEKYEEVSFKVSDKEWVAQFYDKYIKTIKGNPTLAIYEVRSLND